RLRHGGLTRKLTEIERAVCLLIERGITVSDDNELVRATLHGNWEAFGAIVRKYANVLQAVSYEVVRDYHTAQDVAQETFLKAYMNLHTLQKQEKLGSWLYSIARRLSLNARRAKGRHESLEDADRSIG
ncbi:sigma factor, partial [Paenibacillus cisolokensis]|uniref:RNA polymerase sigma factor n=1 Tax=Paenibacillus cisolokensis TaxID=1658519 RepID=UPI003D27BFCE